VPGQAGSLVKARAALPAVSREGLKMSNDMRVTLCGWLANTPEIQRKGDTCWTTFRLGVTPNHYDRRKGSWVDGQTEWVRVTTWDEVFARNVAESLRKGDPVIVTGRLASEQWSGQDGVDRMGLVLRAEAIGHNLKFGYSRFVRVARKADPNDQDEAGAAAAPADSDATGSAAPTSEPPSADQDQEIL
jgi:single-strand DNA-binding protein